MQWENLTAPDFEKAVKETGVCIFAPGVVEKHGDHLPLGTDFLNAHKIACMAAEIEPAVVFPPFYFGQIYEARCFPGTITLKPSLLIEVLQGVFDEIGRNGFKKIIVSNGHGGNLHLFPFMAQCSLWEEKPYNIYIQTNSDICFDSSPETQRKISEICDTPLGHACEFETSITMFNHRNLVDLGKVRKEPAEPLNRTKDLPLSFTALDWYASYPDHYAGDARLASEEKGRKLVQLHIHGLVRYIAAVKADKVLPQLSREFFNRVSKVGKDM